MVVGAWRRKGVTVRPLGGRLPTHIRLSIGAPPENERFIEALRAECCRMMGGHMRFLRSCGRIFP
jgi:histidinol-phosphate/aromatic aminotransferase/cobyric acid decarboxylase-like protein